MRYRDRFQMLVLAALLAFSSSCASLSPRQRAVLSVAAVDAGLSRFQDAERQICNAAMYAAIPPTEKLTTPITTCTGPLAEAAQLTTAKHQAIAARLADAFAVQQRVVLIIEGVSPGQPVPGEVKELQTRVQSFLDLAKALAATDQQRQLVSLGATVVAEVQKIIDAMQGGR